MRRMLAAVMLLLLAVVPAAAQHFLQATAHIATQTTTTIFTNAQASTTPPRALTIMAGKVCVDAGGATTTVTIQDSAGLNLFGTGVVWAIGAGACLDFPFRGYAWGVPTGATRHLQIVTGTGNGPVEVYLELVNQ